VYTDFTPINPALPMKLDNQTLTNSSVYISPITMIGKPGGINAITLRNETQFNAYSKPNGEYLP